MVNAKLSLIDARVDGILQGADDYMAKPFRSREVIARVNMQMMIGKKRRELEEKYLNRTAEMDTIAEYSPVGIARTTPEGTFIQLLCLPKIKLLTSLCNI